MFYFYFLLEIENELKELNFNKVYLFDPKHNKISNGHTSISSFETIQLYEKLEQCSTQPTKPIPFDLKHPVFYIFTSGTTGLPKAAVIKHSRFSFINIIIHILVLFYRFFLGAFGFIVATGMSDKDIMYDTLPLYHSLGKFF